MDGEYHREGDHLGEDVAEEELEFAMQSTLNHERSDPHLEHGMCDPETVIKNSDSVAHGEGCVESRPANYTSPDLDPSDDASDSG